jgi:hypothetical protein
MPLLQKWSDVISEVLKELTKDERFALEMSLEVGCESIGTATLKLFGLDSVEQYHLCLGSAKIKCSEFLNRMYDIKSVADLEFQEPGRSCEGNILRTISTVRPTPPQPEPNKFAHRNLTTPTKKKVKAAFGGDKLDCVFVTDTLTV